MSENKNLKPDWKVWRFDQIATNVTERAEPSPESSALYVGLEHMDSDSLRIRRWGSKTDLIGTKFKMREGDILFARRNAYLKRVAIAPHAGLFSAHGMILRPKPDVVLAEFLPFFMQSDVFMNRAIEISVGSLSPTINWKTMASQEFALPPREQQQRLLVGLVALEGNLIALENAYDAALTLEQARLEDALDLMSSSLLIPIEQLITSRPRNGVSPKANADERGYPTLSLSAVRDGRIISEGNTKYAEITEAQAAAFKLEIDDVLVVRGNGNKLLTGKCGLVDSPMPNGCFYPDLLIRLKFDERIIRPEFAALQWNSQSAHTRFISRAKTTNGIWKINGADIRQHTLKVPSIPEQDALLEEIRSIRRARGELENRKSAAKKLKALALTELMQGGGHGV